MKHILIGFLLFPFFSSAQGPGRAIDVQRYVFSIELTDASDIIKGTARIQYKVLQQLDSIGIDLVSMGKDGKGMQVLSVKIDNKTVGYKHLSNTLSIQNPAKSSAQGTLEINYQGIPADGLIIARNKYKRRTFFSDHWPNRARNWLPGIDHPSDKSAIEFLIIAPVHYQVISNGVQIEETNLDGSRKLTHYREDVPIPMKIAVIGVADFAVSLAGVVDNVPVYSWVYPEDKIKGFYDYGLAVDILPFFTKRIGPFPYKKLANVQSKTIFGGLENAGAIFYNEASVKGDRSMEATIAHEIAHQWFGDMATESDWPHLWLSEGFATYMTILYMENKYGQDTALKMRLEDRKQVIAFAKQRAVPVIDTTVKDYMELLNANSYQKGGWILHMLRRSVGDSIFWKGIRTYYDQYAGKNASSDDFRKVIEQVSGKDLKKFFNQWLYLPGYPQLNITWQYDSQKKTVNVVINQDTDFTFPVEIGLMSNGQMKVTTVEVHGRQTTVNILSHAKPDSIIADPGVHLLHDAKISERR